MTDASACAMPPRVRKLSDRLKEEAQARADDRTLESRSDRSREQKSREGALKDLARRLVDLDRRHFRKLDLDEELLEAVQSAQAITSANAKNRQINVVRQHLRTLDVDALDVRLASISNGTWRALATPGLAPSEAEQWGEKLLTDGDVGLDALLIEFSATAQRQQLRKLVRAVSEARRRGDAGRTAAERATKRLRSAIGAVIASGRSSG